MPLGNIKAMYRLLHSTRSLGCLETGMSAILYLSVSLYAIMHTIACQAILKGFSVIIATTVVITIIVSQIFCNNSHTKA